MSILNAYGKFRDQEEFTTFLRRNFPETAVAVQHAEDKVPAAPALSNQIGGDHYKSLAIQPVAYIHANKIPFIEGSIIKYVTRWRNKGGLKDLEKAKHFIDLLIQLESSSTSL